ncbi:uncharacterized protein LOC131018575 [Salvia miltiorrhiza]|uniref:uncharacterized protein LOC131018575 n=1 Tax=Salvia miltiorrhiza TaxID=226208 RepID=UPI0025ACF75F|nr:uncharacterized protein LOC131018575 [Salvia miltiorrhiza]
MGLEKENEEERLSEYDDSDKERSDSGDSDDLKLILGMRFEDVFQCKKALVSWSIVKGHPIHFRRVSKDQYEAYCEEPYQWRIYASIKKNERYLVVKILGQDHTCAFAIGNKQARYKWLGEEYTEVFRVRPQMCVEDFRNDVKRRFNIAVPNGRLYRAKAHALQVLRGTVQGYYNKLRSYIAELMRVDREGGFELLCGDGCQLLCAIGKDGNNQMYPIAWAVVEVENEACWRWFLSLLLEELGIRDENGFTLISDQQKNSCSELYSGSEVYYGSGSGSGSGAEFLL